MMTEVELKEIRVNELRIRAREYCNRYNDTFFKIKDAERDLALAKKKEVLNG